MFGYSREEAVGRAIVDLVVEPEDRDEDRRRLLSAMTTRPETFEAVRRRKDGSTVHVDVSMRAVTDASGAVTHLAVSKKDVSLLKYLREAAVVESKFRGLLEAAPDAMVLVNEDGRVVLLNRQAELLFGYAREDLLGRPVEMLVPQRHRELYRSHSAAAVRCTATGAVRAVVDLSGLRRDGSEFPAEISLSPVQTDFGALVSAAIRDVTERTRIESALKLANKELESFSYSVAHDLRAPLRGMNGFAQILIDDYSDKLDEEGVDCLREIRSNAVRMGALIDALLALSQVTRSELRPDRVDLSALVREAAAACAKTAPQRAVELNVQDGLWVRADPRLARTLIENLVENAWKFTSRTKAPRVEFGALDAEGSRTYFVSDNGAGFDPAHAGSLFGAFQRLHTVTEFPGTGIGLATAQRIVLRHGGRIWAQGAVGAGATFFFVLPGEREEVSP